VSLFLTTLGTVVAMISLLALGYRCGWLAAEAYLNAAKAVAEIANAAGNVAQECRAALDGNAEAIASLKAESTANKEAIIAGQVAIAEALGELLSGFERAGFVRRAQSVGRQHGESTAAAGDEPQA